MALVPILSSIAIQTPQGQGNVVNHIYHIGSEVGNIIQGEDRKTIKGEKPEIITNIKYITEAGEAVIIKVLLYGNDFSGKDSTIKDYIRTLIEDSITEMDEDEVSELQERGILLNFGEEKTIKDIKKDLITKIVHGYDQGNVSITPASYAQAEQVLRLFKDHDSTIIPTKKINLTDLLPSGDPDPDLDGIY